MEQEAQSAQAIVILQPLIDSGSLNAALTGKAWNIIGLAYQDQGNLVSARNAYEQSIHILKPLPDEIKDYAVALDDLGGFYLDSGQIELAGTIRIKALHLYEKLNDHEGVTIACSNLAGVAFAQKRVRDGRRYLERALQEAKVASGLDDDDLAALSSMQGWLAQFDGDMPGSVSAYRHAINLWRKSHGEDHPMTGWGYMLIGKAHAEAGLSAMALTEMQHGLTILDHMLGQRNPRFLAAEIAYSHVLDQTGAHVDATRLRTTAEQALNGFYNSQCVGCTASAAIFR
ncbi:tetratricopeptide repeat protein [Granulicella arctica]|uniref:Tetratricopeptide (TPR) repeat protein n=1 Tax=Granulicella arctica TaxID=940613 RepID=A0A7Y9PJ79_9BACT|nr:tetratricopeptide repeat protein [Granulicella arctica]NYF80902.1 tetratricopeptide (TPR) repeat protein [Granulicella arctica]